MTSLEHRHDRSRPRQRSFNSHSSRCHPPAPLYFPEYYRDFQKLQDQHDGVLRALINRSKLNKKLRHDVEERERFEAGYRSAYTMRRPRPLLSVNDLFERYQQGVTLVPIEDRHERFSAQKPRFGSDAPQDTAERDLGTNMGTNMAFIEANSTGRTKYGKQHYQTTILRRRLSSCEIEEQQLVDRLLAVEDKIRILQSNWREYHLERLRRYKEDRRNSNGLRLSQHTPPFEIGQGGFHRVPPGKHLADLQSVTCRRWPFQMSSRSMHSSSDVSSERRSPVSTTLTVPDCYQYAQPPTIRGGTLPKNDRTLVDTPTDDWRSGLRRSPANRYQWISDQPWGPHWNPTGVVEDWASQTMPQFPAAGEPRWYFPYSGSRVWSKLKSMQKASYCLNLRQSYSDSALRDVFEFNRLHDPDQGVGLRQLRLQVTCKFVILRRSYSLSSMDAVAGHNERAGINYGS